MSDQERRSEERHLVVSAVKTTIVTCEHEELVGKMIEGETVDVSKGALRMKLELPIPAGGQLDLWVDRPEGEGAYYLTGHVIWSEDRGQGHEVAVKLFEGAATDIDKWREEND